MWFDHLIISSHAQKSYNKKPLFVLRFFCFSPRHIITQHRTENIFMSFTFLHYLPRLHLLIFALALASTLPRNTIAFGDQSLQPHPIVICWANDSEYHWLIDKTKSFFDFEMSHRHMFCITRKTPLSGIQQIMHIIN